MLSLAVVPGLLLLVACHLQTQDEAATFSFEIEPDSTSPPDGIPLEHFTYFRYPVDVVGFKDSREGAEITPEGNIYTGYTELLFLHGRRLSYFPLRKHYWLEEEYLPIIHWVHHQGELAYRFTAFAAPLNLNPERNLIVFLKIDITNNSVRKQEARLATCTRYLPAEAERDGGYCPRHRFRRPATPERTGQYEQEGEEFSTEWRFAFKDDSLLRDGKTLYSYSSSAEPDLYSYRGYETDVGQQFKQPNIASSPVGLASFSKALDPGESYEIEVRMPYRPVEFDSAEMAEIKALDFVEMQEQVITFWEDVLAGGMQIDLPEDKPEYVYKTSLIYDLIARDKIGENYVQKVNEFHYDAFWLRDSSYVVRSYDLGGYHEIAEQCLDFFFNWQREDGNFVSQGGQFDGWGQTLWALGQHYRLTRDADFGDKALPAVMKAAEWLEREMANDPLGVMPITTPGDNEAITGGHVTGHNFWALAGLKNAIAMAEGLGKSEEAAKLNGLYRELYGNLQTVFSKLLRETDNYIPPGLENQGGQDWGNLMAVYPEEILSPRHPAVLATLLKTKEKYREKLMTYADTKYLHHYLTMKNTETWVAKGDQQFALDEFYAVLAHTSSTQAGFEFTINPWSDRDFRANLTPHGWFAAKYRNLLRDMLIREVDTRLILLSVISPAWAKPGDTIVVRNAPTNFGKVSFFASFEEDEIRIEIEPEYFSLPNRIIIPQPYFARFVSSNDGDLYEDELHLFPHVRTVVIEIERLEGALEFSHEKMVRWLINEYRKRQEVKNY